jgi:glycosyltransferase involved in cell wall biosynthesis
MSFAVVIPLYNRARFIAEALDAVLSQSYPAAEIIVVDDGSTDGGAGIVERYAGRVTLLRFPQNRGQQAARNAAVAKAKSQWIAFCDSDDLWLPDHLLRHSQMLVAYPDVKFSFSDFAVEQDGRVIIPSKFGMAPAGYWEDADRRIVLEGWLFGRNVAPATIRWHPIFPSATVVARQLALDVGGFNVAMPRTAEDGEFTLRCLYRGHIAAIPEPTVLIRRHGGNISGNNVQALLGEITALGWIRTHHPEARLFLDVIESEIRRRRLLAVHGAFAAKRHDIVRQLLADLPHSERTVDIKLKSALAHMPESLGHPLNGLLQRLSETIKSRSDSSRFAG